MRRRSAEVGPLLPADAFQDLADALRGKTVLFLPPLTKNVGTALTVRGAVQFFGDHDVIVVNDWDRDELPDDPGAVDCLVYGGGMVGTIREKGSATRKWLVADYLARTGLPVIALPMTHMGSEGEPKPPGKYVMFARESKSLKYLPESRLAPDMAFYWKGSVPAHETDSDCGTFLRADPLSFVSKHWQRGLGDPVKFVNTLDEYFDLASRFEHIHTDRLMFAVCALLLGRKVTLMPDGSGKNRAVYEAWLKGVGCLWNEPGVLLQ
jgi:exopolysaccharide biosynthesis predicted pyruvyltransferase EpsI